MIISHKYRFIFIKTEKTAGTSIEIALSRICGPEDIITPIMKKDEEIRRSLGARGPQNYNIPFKFYTKKDWLHAILKLKRKKFYNHISSKEIKENIPTNVWDSYFKFTFDRNLFDKVISHFYWRNHSCKTLLEFINAGFAGDLRAFELYTIRGIVAVDRIFDFTQIKSSLDIIQQIICSEEIMLPDKRAKGATRKDKRNYREILTIEEKELIEIIFAREIALLGYKF